MPRSVREVTRSAFLAANPGWELGDNDVDLYTGLVRGAELQSPPSAPTNETGPSDAEYRAALTEPLRRNAVFLGLRPTDLDSLVWYADRALSSAPLLRGRTAVGRIPCRSPEISQLRGNAACWNVQVTPGADASHIRYSVARLDPPVDVCTDADLTAEQAKATPGILDAARRPEDLVVTGAPRDFSIEKKELGEAHLVFQSDYRGQEQRWRLLWRVDAQKGELSFWVDPMSGELLEMHRHALAGLSDLMATQPWFQTTKDAFK